MTDFLDWGASWLTEMTDEHVSFTVTCSWSVDGVETSNTLRANVVDEAGNLVKAAVNVRLENTMFLFNRSEVEEKAIPLLPGLRITWGSTLYELVKMGSKTNTYNDTYRNKVLVATKYVTD